MTSFPRDWPSRRIHAAEMAGQSTKQPRNDFSARALDHELQGNPSMNETRNRVVQVRRFGDPDGLEVVDAPLPAAGRGEVRVRVLASSIEYADVTIRRHLYPWVFRLPPFVMGYDVVGEIDQLGDGVSGLQLDDRVAEMTVIGSNAAYRTLRADRLTRVPAGVDAAEAATLILSWTTAYQLLHRAARVQRGQRVLVQGAAGAVGQALLVLGRMAGLELWGTARGEHAPLIRELGGMPIDYRREDFTRVLPDGFDVIFDGIGEDGYRRSFAALKRGGLLCAYGYTAGVQAQRRMLTMLMWVARLYFWRWLPGGKRARGYSINVMRARHPAWFREDLERLFGMLATGAIRPRIAERISFDEVAEAHRRLEAGGLEGKLVLCPDILSSRSRQDAPGKAESSVGAEGLASDAASSMAQPESPTISEDSPDEQELERRRDIVRRFFNDFWKSADIKPATFAERLNQADGYINERLAACGEIWRLNSATRKQLGLPPHSNHG
jgi:NADPH:quinone reductase